MLILVSNSFFTFPPVINQHSVRKERKLQGKDYKTLTQIITAVLIPL